MWPRGFISRPGFWRQSGARRRTGRGQEVTLALSDVMLATVSNLGYLADVQVNQAVRQPLGNDLYGAFGRDFATSDKRRIMLAAISNRQWRAIGKATGLADRLAMVGPMMDVDLDTEGGRFEARHAICALLEPWFGRRTLAEIRTALEGSGVLWGPYQDFGQLVHEDPRCSLANPIFGAIAQHGGGGNPRQYHPPWIQRRRAGAGGGGASARGTYGGGAGGGARDFLFGIWALEGPSNSRVRRQALLLKKEAKTFYPLSKGRQCLSFAGGGWCWESGCSRRHVTPSGNGSAWAEKHRRRCSKSINWLSMGSPWQATYVEALRQLLAWGAAACHGLRSRDGDPAARLRRIPGAARRAHSDQSDRNDPAWRPRPPGRDRAGLPGVPGARGARRYGRAQ